MSKDLDHSQGLSIGSSIAANSLRIAPVTESLTAACGLGAEYTQPTREAIRRGLEEHGGDYPSAWHESAARDVK